ncbi:MAG TPA: tetratricopeptide repeat protein [Blastocatellia bacterium]|nr:tetratricopeptide repeat protein [Blastocatellia bacterium]HMZ18810.1 tetratricopeptide repeat protein [Blastocatellia bacterium]HNG29823.1 tetratricopeptide repeat protein [Blastocatellia bacterium]
MFISPAQIQPIKELYNRGLYLQAYEAALQLAPLEQWEGTDALLIAGRLAGMLGAPKLARRFHLKAWREDRAHAEAIYYYARAVWEWRGPWRAWMFMRRVDELPDADDVTQSDWFSLRAGLFAVLRDFDAAEALITRAEKLTPENPWMWIEKSSLLEFEDRYEEALAAARRALKLRPLYRPALQSLAHLLGLLDREAEARQLLESAVSRLECPSLLTQLAQLQIDTGDFAAARANLQLALDLSPLLEKEVCQALNGRLADAAYLSGDVAAAAALAEQAGEGFFKTIAKRLCQTSPEQKHVMLPVGFIRQHHVTCAPATLTTISKFWQMPAEHLNIAEQICYGGTTDHSERKWAEQNGWTAREFCVNWDDAVKLIERGVPFTLATVEPGNAHLQAVIGYDARRGTLLMRDPYTRSLGEALSPELFEHYRSTGPRGMALVPNEKNSLLAELELPELKDAALYDRLHAIQHALYEHRREDALQIWQTMETEVPNHRLTLNARLAIAWYDEDQAQVLACVEKLLAQFPEDANLKMQKIVCLRILARRSERVDYLETICRDEKSDPLFWQQYAQELSEDARQHRPALRLLHRALRARPVDAGNFFQLANIRWAQREFDEALELYRFASCLKDTSEQYVQSYFVAARHLRRTQEALDFLKQRFQRFGKRNGSPAYTLAWAYEQTGQSQQALELLPAAIELRPEDGELILYASDMFARHGDFDQAEKLLQRAAGKAPRTQWLRNSAMVASYRGKLEESLKLWRQVIEVEPLAIDANRNVAQLLAETEGREQALEFWRAVTERFPHSLPLHQLRIDWLRDDPEAAEAALRHVVEFEPANAWARRELAYNLCQQRRYEEALEEAVTGRELEPEIAFGHCAIGTIHAEMGNFPMARLAFREAIRLSVDAEYAINELMASSHTNAERRESLEFIQQELIRQVTFGDGLQAYRQAARTTLAGEEVLKLLQAALDARPDLWHAWSVMVFQLMDLQRLDEALRIAKEATERFPLLPRVWLDLAAVHQARLDQNGLMEALQQARRINPAWSVPTQQLAECHQRAGDFGKARELIEQAIVYAPLDHTNYGYLAEVLWQLGEREKAIEKIRHAVTIEPGYDWGWRALRDWAQQIGKPELALEYARALTAKRPKQARSWLILAQTEAQEVEERLQAVERAIELNPYLVDAHGLKSRLLTQLRRYDQARLACHPAVYGGTLPPELRCAEAIIEADRGDLQEAVKQLRMFVEEEPNYYPAWNLLADWYRATDAKQQYLDAAGEMVRLAPHRPVPLGYLAEAQLFNDDRARAKETLQHALTLDPAYEFAGTALFDLQLQDYDLDAAERTLGILRRQIGGDAALLRDLKLAGKRKHFERAREHFKALCLSANTNPSFIAEAVSAEVETDWNAIVDGVIEETLSLPQANPYVGVVFVERCEASRKWETCRRRLLSLPERGELWRKAIGAYLEALANAGEKHRARQLIAELRNDLRGHVQTWGNTGYVLFNLGDVRSTIDWLADWRERAEVESWMLWNLSVALSTDGRDRESHEVCLHALTLPSDDLTQSHTLLVAFRELLGGKVVEAVSRLSAINEPTLREWDRFLWQIVCALRDFHQMRDIETPNHVETVDRLLELMRETDYFKGSEMLVRLNRQAILYLAKDQGSLIFTLSVRARLWWASIVRSVSAR